VYRLLWVSDVFVVVAGQHHDQPQLVLKAHLTAGLLHFIGSVFVESKQGLLADELRRAFGSPPVISYCIDCRSGRRAVLTFSDQRMPAVYTFRKASARIREPVLTLSVSECDVLTPPATTASSKQGFIP
jgi:hypothetical protein